MARVRTLSNLEAEARARADVVNADDRHTSSDVWRYINQGGAELRDLLIEVRGRSFFRSATPLTFVTDGVTTKTDLPDDFFRLISVRIDGINGATLDCFGVEDEPNLRRPGYTSSFPTHYELQPTQIEILPLCSAGVTMIVDYIPTYRDLVSDDDVLEGFNGWEEYVVDYAAKQIAIRDADWDLVNKLSSDLKALTARIQKLAANRDAFRAERVKDVRQTRFFGARQGRMRRF